MGTMINRRRAYGGKSLPYDYEVEYLEGAGAQYIDTGYYPNTNTVIKTKILAKPAGKPVCGARWSGEPTYDEFGITFSSLGNMYAFYFGRYTNNEYYFFRDINGSIANIVEFGIDFIRVNQTSVSISRGVFVSPLSLFIFGKNQSTTNNSNSRIYYFKMYNNNDIILDFIPVVKDNIGYMYDKVSGQLFGNQGTGSFIVGPRVS